MFDWVARIGLIALVAPLRRWDFRAAQRPDYIIANSHHIQAEIKKYYKRASVVIHPPVYFERFQNSKHRKKKREGFVISGRQTPYKRFDLAIKACNELNVPLTVIGDGPEHRKLRRMGEKTVTFLGRVSDEIVEEEFARAEGLIFPGLDDFGITAVEALAAGTPVVAYKAGGALDYVRPGKTGEFFTKQTVNSLVNSLKTVMNHPYNAKDCRLMAQTFSTQVFNHKMQVFVQRALLKAKK